MKSPVQWCWKPTGTSTLRASCSCHYTVWGWSPGRNFRFSWHASPQLICSSCKPSTTKLQSCWPRCRFYNLQPAIDRPDSTNERTSGRRLVQIGSGKNRPTKGDRTGFKSSTLNWGYLSCYCSISTTWVWGRFWEPHLPIYNLPSRVLLRPTQTWTLHTLMCHRLPLPDSSPYQVPYPVKLLSPMHIRPTHARLQTSLPCRDQRTLITVIVTIPVV